MNRGQSSAEARPGRTRSHRSLLWLASLIFVLGSAISPNAAHTEQPVTIFAAASTTTAINEIAAVYEDLGLGAVRPVFAASSTLAKQIARGAPADLFLSANVAWMDYLEERDHLVASSRGDLLGNRLVLIALKERPLSIDIEAGFDLAGVLGGGRLAMGDPEHVPAGIYAKAALETLDAWDGLNGHTAHTANVRAAMALVERGAAAAGIVYASDAAISSKVATVGSFPSHSHPPIVYPLAIVTDQTRRAVTAFRDFLRGPEAQEIFARSGFQLLQPQS